MGDILRFEGRVEFAGFLIRFGFGTIVKYLFRFCCIFADVTVELEFEEEEFVWEVEGRSGLTCWILLSVGGIGGGSVGLSPFVGVLPNPPISNYLLTGRLAHNLIGGITALHKNTTALSNDRNANEGEVYLNFN